MRVGDLEFEPFIGRDELERQVSRLADELNRRYAGHSVVVCPVLTGSFMFAADLLRQFSFEAEVCFVSYTSYRGTSSSGAVEARLPFPESVRGREVLIVEDVIDTGLSMEYMVSELQRLQPVSVEICSLFYKPEVCRPTVKPTYAGFEIGKEFIVGYGLDYNGMGRNLPEIYITRQ